MSGEEIGDGKLAACALIVRIILGCQILSRDGFEGCRNVFAFIAGFGVAAKDKVGAGADEPFAVPLAEQMICL